MRHIMEYDLIIIGSGPAGYVAAIRAGQVGLKTAIVEKDNIGGVCLNTGCIPSKALLESAKLFQKVKKEAKNFGIDGIATGKLNFNWNQAVKRSTEIVEKLTSGVNFLLKKNGIEVIAGTAKINSENSVIVDGRTIHAEKIIIATGSHSRSLNAKLPDDLVISMEAALSKNDIPENLVIVGENAYAVELAQLFAMIGKNVTLLVSGGHILPLADKRLTDYMTKKLKRDKIRIVKNIGDQLNAMSYTKGELSVGDVKFACDLIINGQKRIANIPESDIDFDISEEYLHVNEYCQTKYPTIYAVGDVNGIMNFAHAGSAQGLLVINHIKGIKKPYNRNKYPLNMYTHPEVAQIGLTEQDVIKEENSYKVSEFPLTANGKALAEGNTEGFVRIISDTTIGEVLGVQIIAPNATDMIAEASAFMQVESTVYDVAETIHAHPTISEIFMEAGFEAVDQAIHR